jgi:hypothetical protein
MDERVRAIAERNGIARSEVTVKFIEPRSSNGATANGNASSNGNGSQNGHAPSRKARVRKPDVATAAAPFPAGFTLAQIVATVGCSPGAAKQHAVALAADGVLAKTGETRENGAAVWKLRDGDSEVGAKDGERAEPSGGANPGSADPRFPAVPVGSGSHETRNPVTAMAEHSQPGEGLISLPEPEPAADPIALALAELARRRQLLEAAEQALAAVADSEIRALAGCHRGSMVRQR